MLKDIREEVNLLVGSECVCAQVLTLCKPMACSLLVSFVYAIFPGKNPPPGDFPNPGIEPVSLESPALTGRFFTTSATWGVLGIE